MGAGTVTPTGSPGAFRQTAGTQLLCVRCNFTVVPRQREVPIIVGDRRCDGGVEQ